MSKQTTVRMTPRGLYFLFKGDVKRFEVFIKMTPDLEELRREYSREEELAGFTTVTNESIDGFFYRLENS